MAKQSEHASALMVKLGCNESVSAVNALLSNLKRAQILILRSVPGSDIYVANSSRVLGSFDQGLKLGKLENNTSISNIRIQNLLWPTGANLNWAMTLLQLRELQLWVPDSHIYPSIRTFPTLPTTIGRLTSLLSFSIKIGMTAAPTEIGELVSLKRLEMYSNALTSIPSEVGKLRALTKLEINQNYRLRSLPTTVGELTTLQRLHCENTNLTSLPSELGRLTELDELTVNGNSLQRLPFELGDMVKLTLLQLRKNRITECPAVALRLFKLTNLDLRNNTITSCNALGLLQPQLQVAGAATTAPLPLNDVTLTTMVRLEGNPVCLVGGGSNVTSAVPRHVVNTSGSGGGGVIQFGLRWKATCN